MNSYTMHTFAVGRQREFLAEADRTRHAKAARAAARGTQAPGRHPLIWLRDAAGTFASRLTSPTRAHHSSH
jgi:hypothetical protein